MKLRVKNLGPIKQGEIDLSKRFFVFVGYNNTGKTYMAQVLWSVLDYFGQYVDDEAKEKKQTIYEIPTLLENETFIIKDYFQEKINYIQQALKKKIIDDLNNDSLRLTFDIDLSDFINAFKLGEYHFIYGEVERHFTVNKLRNSLDISIKKISEIEFNKGFKDVYRVFYDTKGINKPLDEAFIKPLIDKLNPQQFFLPASRSFYTTFYNYVFLASKTRQDAVQKLLKDNKNIDSSAIKQLLKSDFTQPMDALNYHLFRLNLTRKNTTKSSYKYLLEELKTLIGGDIIIKNGGEGISPIEIKYRLPNGEELEMYSTSSSSNQLTPLHLYLKYWVREENNFLIMDEPEENLHPKNQIALLNLLMKFANQNDNKVLITTHSPLITDAVNNHLHLGYLKSLGEDIDVIIEENNLNIDKDAAMAHEDIGVYFFDGQSIKPYEVNDYGVFFRDFRKYEKEVEDTSNLLSSRIYDVLEKRNDNLHKLNQ